MSIDALDVHAFTGLVMLLKQETITDKSGIEVLRVMLDQRLNKEPCETADAIVRRLNLAKTSGDDGALAAIIADVISQNPKAVEDYRSGKNGALNFLVGQVMKQTRGRSDPGELNRMIVESLKQKDA